MNFLSGGVLLVLGLWLSWIDIRALSTGRLPFGRKAMWETLVFERAESPARFWAAFAAYGLIAIWMFACAARYFSGQPPLFPFKGWA